MSNAKGFSCAHQMLESGLCMSRMSLTMPQQAHVFCTHIICMQRKTWSVTLESAGVTENPAAGGSVDAVVDMGARCVHIQWHDRQAPPVLL